MISKLKMVVIATALFWGPLIHVSHAQQAQTESQAVQVIGLAGLKENTKGRLTVVNGTLRFVHAKGNADVTAASIEDVVTAKDSQRVIGGKFGTVVSVAAPYGSGSVLSLLRKKVDILTIQYRDADGGLHGAVFTMPRGKADPIKKELVAQGAHTSEPILADLIKSLADSREEKR
ncbi:MAG TPA: hypothetical protein VGW76_03570 [Pyrinomonadaceae bacterium]|nr:hypothetical protein [Pyrinomonadaceae bacterium]